VAPPAPHGLILYKWDCIIILCRLQGVARDFSRDGAALGTQKSHSLSGMAFLVPRRGFTLKGINFDSPRAKQQKREAPKGVSRFWNIETV
jgi:hypothetical protein